MEEKKKKIKEELKTLEGEGLLIYLAELANKKQYPKDPQYKDLLDKKKVGNLAIDYQSWYSRSLPIIRQLLPERYKEFQDQYRNENRKEIDFLTYTISDYLIGLKVTRGRTEVVSPIQAFSAKFQHQIAILQSANDRIDSLLTDLEGILQSDLFNHELEAAEDLLKKNHLRAAGALAGVSLEIHLNRVCINHNIIVKKKNPAISDYNDALKEANIIDLITWRNLQYLGDIRNICVHKKDREPTKDDVTALLSGIRKTISSVF